MRVLLLTILALLCGCASANETYLVRAKQVDYFEISDDACLPDAICIMHGWFRYQIDGWSVESGEEISQTVAGLSHTWYRTDAPWLVTLEPTEGNTRYDFLEVDFVIAEIDIFDHFVCLDESRQISEAKEDVVYEDEWSDDENPRKCYSYHSFYDVLPDRRPQAN